MSRPTIWMQSLWRGWNAIWMSTTGTVVFVTHDRYFLDNVAKWILEIDNGRGVPWEGNYSSWLEQKQKKLHKQNKARGKQRTLAKRTRVDSDGYQETIST